MSSLLPSTSDLLVHSQYPYNAEPPLTWLRASFTTPQSHFYGRTLGNIPRLNKKTPTRVEGRVSTQLYLAMAELRARFRRRTVLAVMQCAGNRRSDMQQVRPVSGDTWAPGVIGNAEWSGVAAATVPQGRWPA